MALRFSTPRVVAPDLVPSPAPAPEDVPQQGATTTLLAEMPAEATAPVSSNPLLTDKLLDAKVRLHRRLIEEINLPALEKLPEEEMRAHIQQLVSQYVL